jgi:hypothetical protein
MSHSCHSSVVIGLRIDKANAVKRVLKKGCNHPVPNDAKFCPECGKVREFVEEKSFYDEFQPYEVYTNFGKVLIGLEIAEASDAWNNDDKDMSFVNSRQLDRVLEVEKALKPLIEKQGLPWKESEFGIWLMVHR